MINFIKIYIPPVICKSILCDNFFFIALFFLSPVFSNITVYFNYGVFNTGNNKPYLETYLTITGNSVKFLPVNGAFQANINISWKILNGKEIVKESKYNLMSPLASDTLHLPSFIDNQRFSLDNGAYTLELVVTDNANLSSKSVHSEKININLKREKKLTTLIFKYWNRFQNLTVNLL